MIGKTISHYKILGKLGEGGMGVVYKAEDTRLKRTVALKFLPPLLATQDAAKKRFIHEAQAASSLEHPNICAVYDIGEAADGQMFIAMPHYEGETLQEKIAKGPVEAGEVIDIVVQLATGLAKAHEQGIVHRDIKPGNIFLTKDGHVKILDFGLAKLATQTRLTKSGTTVGTVAYMSPEQASGGDVDARSDIFSLGAVFYELLTGEVPFKGDHEAAIIYGIMNNDPEPVQTCRGDMPEGLQQIFDTVFKKPVDERYQTALDFRDALVELGWHTGTQKARARGTGAVSRSPVRRAVRWIVLGGAVLALALFVMRNSLRSPSHDPDRSISPTYNQLTFTGDARDPIISPDGQFVAYLRETVTRTELLVRDVGGGEPIVLLDGITFVGSLRWSPDSSKLLIAAIRRGGGKNIHIIPRLGGSVRRLKYYLIADWSPDGRRLAVTWKPWKKISFVDVSTGREDENSLDLEFPFTWINDLDWSPDGNRLLVHISPEDGGQEVWTIGNEGGDPILAVRERELLSARWAPSGGSIYYVVPRGATEALWRVGVDPRSGDVTGEPVMVLGGITGFGPHLEFSSDGKMLTYARNLVDRDLWLLPADRNQEEGESVPTRLTSGTAVDDWPSISPDGREIAFVRVMGETSNIFIMPIEGGAARQVTFMDSESFCPDWSPDGLDIAFVSSESGENRLWKVSAKGGAAKVFENTRAGEDPRLMWAPGGSIFYGTPAGRNYMILDPDSGEETPLVANEDVGWINDLMVSPDGNSVAVMWNRPRNGGDGLWIISMEDSSQVFVRPGYDQLCGWSLDGRWIYYANVPRIGRVRVDGSNTEVILSLPFEDIGEHPLVTMTPDARNFVAGFEVKRPSDIWLVENFDTAVR